LDDDAISLGRKKSGKGKGPTCAARAAAAEAAAEDVAYKVQPLPPIANEFTAANALIEGKFFKEPAEFNTQQFLGAKSALKAAIILLFERLGDPKQGLIGDILVEEEKLRKKKGRSDDLNISTDDLVKTMTDAVEKLGSAKSELVPAKAPLLAHLKKVYFDVYKSLEQTFKDYGDHLPALRQRNEDAGKAHKVEFQQEYWKKRRVHECFTSGGHEAAWAKACCVVIAADHYRADEEAAPCNHGTFQNDPKRGEFSDDIVTTFYQQDLITKFRGLVSSNKAAFESKKTKLEQSLVQNPQWPGAAGVVSEMNFEPAMLHMLSDIFGEDSKVLTQMPGGRAWLRQALCNSNNFGPVSNMLPGLACLYWLPWDRISLVIYPFSGLLAKGVTTEAFEDYFKTPHPHPHPAKKLAQDNMTVVHLRPHEFAYVPEGMMVHVVKFEQPSGKKGWRAQPFAFCHLALHKALRMVPELKTAFLEWNDSTFSSRSSTMWKERKEFFDAVCALEPLGS
jgi:hypothetical protein